jgi:hypothetical protein
MNTMKKYLILFAFAITLFACENKENDFPDFDYQTVYFPIQYPARTLILGESRSDNSIDLEHAFSIGVSVGGMYENTKERVVDIALAPELVEGVTVEGRTLQILPANYYESMEFSSITIPAGKFDGKIRVNLTDAFFTDPFSTAVNYVVPLKILPSTQDSVLTGVPLPEIGNAADRRVNADWMPGFEPKDYTLFAIKYINKYHGTYLHRGVDETLDAENGNVLSTRSYQEKYIENDLQTLLTTKSLSESYLNRLGGNNQGDNFKIVLTFTESGTISLSSENDALGLSGSGTFVNADDASADVWGGEGRLTIKLDYKYKVGDEWHRAKDVLVYRDNNMTYEEFSITIE